MEDVVRAEEPLRDDPVIRRVSAARPRVPEDDLSPAGRRAQAIRERVLSRSTPDASPAPRGRRWRWIGAPGPAIGIALTVAIVVAVVLIVGGVHARRGVTTPASPHRPVAPPPPPASLLPAHGGMRGLLSTPQLVGSGPDLTAIFMQCPRCRTSL